MAVLKPATIAAILVHVSHLAVRVRVCLSPWRLATVNGSSQEHRRAKPPRGTLLATGMVLFLE